MEVSHRPVCYRVAVASGRCLEVFGHLMADRTFRMKDLKELFRATKATASISIYNLLRNKCPKKA